MVFCEQRKSFMETLQTLRGIRLPASLPPGSVIGSSTALILEGRGIWLPRTGSGISHWEVAAHSEGGLSQLHVKNMSGHVITGGDEYFLST